MPSAASIPVNSSYRPTKMEVYGAMCKKAGKTWNKELRVFILGKR